MKYTIRNRFENFLLQFAGRYAYHEPECGWKYKWYDKLAHNILVSIDRKEEA